MKRAPRRVRPPGWGSIADPEPGIIYLLRAIQSRRTIAPKDLEATFRSLDAILADWIKYEDIKRLNADLMRVPEEQKRLRSKLGVELKQVGPRRTQRTVKQETRVVNALIEAANNGRDVSTFEAAAKELSKARTEYDPRTIERMWKAWGEFYLRVWEATYVSTGWASKWPAVLKRLPASDTK